MKWVITVLASALIGGLIVFLVIKKKMSGDTTSQDLGSGDPAPTDETGAIP